MKKENGVKLVPLGDDKMKFLDKIFNNDVGKYELAPDSKIKNLNFLTPQPDTYNFEVSGCKNRCWRVDVYPPKESDGSESYAFVRFCVKTKTQNLIVRHFAYLLEAKELGKVNKE